MMFEELMIQLGVQLIKSLSKSKRSGLGGGGSPPMRSEEVVIQVGCNDSRKGVIEFTRQRRVGGVASPMMFEEMHTYRHTRTTQIT